MRIIIFSALVISSLLISSGSFASACYTRSEAEADQGVRIHSELMVIGLNCQHMGKRLGHNLYGQYREFTARHADLFAGYEGTLMAFWDKNGEKPEANLNELRTKYANKISKDAAAIRPDVFCSRYAPRMIKAYEMEREEVKEWASTIFPSHPVSYPLCETLAQKG